MGRPCDQSPAGLRKDLDDLTRIYNRAKANKRRDPQKNSDVLAMLSWIKLVIAEESCVRGMSSVLEDALHSGISRGMAMKSYRRSRSDMNLSKSTQLTVST